MFENNIQVNPWMSITIDIPLGHIVITVSTVLLSKSSKLQPKSHRPETLSVKILTTWTSPPIRVHKCPAAAHPPHIRFPLLLLRSWAHPSYAFWEAWNSSCAQSVWSVYLGDWFGVKLSVIFIKNKGMYWPAFCTILWWSEHFPSIQCSPQAERKNRVESTAPNSFTVWLNSLLGSHIFHWLLEVLNSSPKISLVLWLLEAIGFMMILTVPSSLKLLFL